MFTHKYVHSCGMGCPTLGAAFVHLLICPLELAEMDRVLDAARKRRGRAPDSRPIRRTA